MAYGIRQSPLLPVSSVLEIAFSGPRCILSVHLAASRARKGGPMNVDDRPWFVPVEDFEPPQPGEHPRLLFRRSDLPALRKKAETPGHAGTGG